MSKFTGKFLLEKHHKIVAKLFLAVGILSIAAPSNAYTIRPIDEDTTGFKDVIDEYQQFVQPEGIVISNPKARQVDATKLKLATDHEVRIFFLNEGAGKISNQLKFTASGDASQPSPSIFGNISCSDPNCQLPETEGTLKIGDWVNLGSFSTGTLFDFLLESVNDKDGEIDVYGTNPALNPDGLDHVVAYEYKNRIVLGFEDLLGPQGTIEGRNEGSDRDFNDIVMVVDLPVSVPEPASTMGFVAIGLIFGTHQLRKYRKASQKHES
ncbi:DUF4114 domain-containing protein [Lusitaniella coriacea]|uniref:DUF4114 domain-containing protein n=1 Tax=Lusitaniella coriacea TaxID=1983105 RepID=UPI003CED3237